MKYEWTADRTTGRIVRTNATYQSKTNGTSTLQWNYGDFVAVGSKFFPANHNFKLATPAVSGKETSFEVTLRLKKIDTDGNFEKKTDVSSRYKQITVEQAVKRIMNL